MSFIGAVGLKLALVLIHDKGVAANRAQIAFVLNRTELRRWTPDPLQPDAFREYRAFTALARPHEVVAYQVVPLGTARPSNMGLLQPSRNVIYGNDQPSHDRRFFNWGLKRPTDEGADVMLYLDATASFSLPDLDDARDFRELPWGRVVRPRLQQRLGSGRREVLREDLALADAFADLRQRIDAAGLTRA